MHARHRVTWLPIIQRKFLEYMHPVLCDTSFTMWHTCNRGSHGPVIYKISVLDGLKLNVSFVIRASQMHRDARISPIHLARLRGACSYHAMASKWEIDFLLIYEKVSLQYLLQ